MSFAGCLARPRPTPDLRAGTFQPLGCRALEQLTGWLAEASWPSIQHRERRSDFFGYGSSGVKSDRDPWFLSRSAFLEGAVLLDKGPAGNTRGIGEAVRYGHIPSFD
jgi:hypothetical protein